jgi:predicted permease
MSGFNPVEILFNDLRYGLRMMRRSPGVTAVAILSLALGIGANTAIFSVVDALMLRTLRVRSPEQLVELRKTSDSSSGYNPWFGYLEFEKIRDRTEVFSSIAAINLLDRSNSGTVNGPDAGLDSGRLSVGLVSGTYFDTMGADAVRGRALAVYDDQAPGGHPVTVISYGYWKRRFALAPDVVGRTLTLNGTAYTILGVTQSGFSGEWVGQPTDLWIPMAMQSQAMPDRPGLLSNDKNRSWLRVLGRLKPNVTIQQAQAAVDVTYAQIERESVGANPTPQEVERIAGRHLGLESAARGYSPQRRDFAQPLGILMIIVVLVLLITCANMANLLLARSAARQREMAVRMAIGAGRMRIVRQLLTESILLAMMGGLIGLLLAVWGTNSLSTLTAQGPARMGSNWVAHSVSLEVRPDARILAFTIAACVLTGILFGLAPAFRGSKVALSPALTGRGADSHGAGRRFGLRKMLVILQVALSLPLLVGAGLFVRTLRNLQSQNLGVDQEHLLMIWTAPEQTGRVGAALADLYPVVQERLSRLPGVLSVSPSTQGLLDGGPVAGGPSDGFRVEGQPSRAGLLMRQTVIAPRFFETAGIPMLLGRDFTEWDAEKAPRVAIVNETMAHFFFGDENPIGKHFGMYGEVGTPWEIVGVVKAARYWSPRTENQGVCFMPYRQYLGFVRTMCVLVRTVGDPTPIAAEIRQELREIDPNLPVLRINTMKEHLNEVLGKERLIAVLSGAFGVLAGVLACLGLYGVMSYTAARKTNEMGIRLALGATPTGVQRIVMRESLSLAFLGIAIGLPATVGASRVIANLLFGISAADPLIIGGAALLMIGVAALAGFLPARRAARVDPMVALRWE